MTPGEKGGTVFCRKTRPGNKRKEAGAAFRKTFSGKNCVRKTCLRGTRDTSQCRAVRIKKDALHVFSKNPGSHDRRDKKAGREGVRSAVTSVRDGSRLRTDPRSS